MAETLRLTAVSQTVPSFLSWPAGIWGRVRKGRAHHAHGLDQAMRGTS